MERVVVLMVTAVADACEGSRRVRSLAADNIMVMVRVRGFWVTSCGERQATWIQRSVQFR